MNGRGLKLKLGVVSIQKETLAFKAINKNFLKVKKLTD